ncbi:hypothetical protein E5Q_01420 [Mixia osmundae IAM 14324]|uniref:F-box domain-containing protein n=1 Tax=Mixia osmundae (strain CBS 9802 / IAM 14324 / JCM 22182 / KY 12970) TaxID=764103 RepID=G7DW78_MIXOS|nr:hypothetical protein E5Q_01420 [Mixia osmundae IAM 14324]
MYGASQAFRSQASIQTEGSSAPTLNRRKSQSRTFGRLSLAGFASRSSLQLSVSPPNDVADDASEGTVRPAGPRGIRILQRQASSISMLSTSSSSSMSTSTLRAGRSQESLASFSSLASSSIVHAKRMRRISGFLMPLSRWSKRTSALSVADSYPLHIEDEARDMTDDLTSRDEAVDLFDLAVRLDLLNAMPLEIALHTLSLLDLETLCTARLVCKSWEKLVSTPYLWKLKFDEQPHWKIRPELIESSRMSYAYPPSSAAETIRSHRTSILSRRLSDLVDSISSISLHSTNRPISMVSHRSSRVVELASEGSSRSRRQSMASLSLTPLRSSMELKRASRASRASFDLSALDAAKSPASSTRLDWQKLFHDRYLLQKRWQSGDCTTQTLRGHADGIYTIQASDDLIVTGSRDQTIRVWDARTGATKRILKGHTASVLCLQYDNLELISGSSDGLIRVWSLSTGKVKSVLSGHALGVLDLRFDDSKLISCSKDATLKLWCRATGSHVRTLHGHSGPVNALGLQGNQAVSASGDCSLRLWDLASGQTVRQFKGHERGLASVSWHGDLIASGSNDETVRIWSASTGECLNVLTGGHVDLVRALAFAPGGNFLVSAGYDGGITIWNPHASADEDTRVSTFSKAHNSLVFSLYVDLGRIISVSADKKIIVRDFGRDLDLSPFLS